MNEKDAFELNRRIAEALGYVFESAGDSYPDGFIRVIAPDTSSAVRFDGDNDLFAGTHAGTGLSDWAGDLNAAFGLFDGSETEFSWLLNRAPYTTNVVWYDDDHYAHFSTGEADTRVEAVCKAWLAWKEVSNV